MRGTKTRIPCRRRIANSPLRTLVFFSVVFSFPPRFCLFTVACFSVILSPSCGPGAPYGKVLLGELTTEGVVDFDYLAAQLVPLEPRFQACYARALRLNHASEGVIQFSIDGREGRLLPKVVSNTTRDTVLTNCVTQAIAGLPMVERGVGPWAFQANWSVEFAIARRRTATHDSRRTEV